MFTGIVKELGVVRRIDAAGSICKLEILSSRILEEAVVGDSVSVNGVCLTVTGRSGGALAFDVMAETVRRTTLAGLRSKDKVNLENSVRIGGGMDGHFVLGHVDCVGTFKEAREKGEEFIIQITIPDGFDHLLVEKGSVTIDGVSLTVGEVEKRTFCVYLIPHTLKETTLGSKGPGSRVNVEFDIIGKYVAKLEASARPGITEDFLRARGF